MVVWAVAVLTAPSTTSAAAAGLGRTSAWAASAPPAAAAAVSSERRERDGAGTGWWVSAAGCPADSVRFMVSLRAPSGCRHLARFNRLNLRGHAATTVALTTSLAAPSPVDVARTSIDR